MINISELRSMVNATQFESFANSVINSLLDRLEEVEKENIKLRKALAQKVTSETMLRDLSVGNGSINASFEGGAVHLLVDSLATQFVESGAHNYIEMQFHSEATGPLLLTLQRVNGMTPHELLAKVEKERDILCDRLVLESQKNRALHEAVNRACEERDDLRIALRHEADCVEAAKAEIEALGAKIAEMEQQEPVAEIVSFGSSDLKEVTWKKGKMPALGSKLYALPGTQALLRVPDAVIDALDNLDDYMSRIEGNDRGVCNHINLLRRYLVDATEVGENK